MDKCIDCNKPIRKLKTTKDWTDRRYHLKCYNKCQKTCEAIDMAISCCADEDKAALLILKEKIMPSKRK